MKKRITLLGDSIRLGYEGVVRAKLSDVADIWSPDGNCMHSVHHLFNLDPWYFEPAADLIHLNFGLWDCRRLGRERTENTIPVDLFVRNLDYILGRVRATSAMQIIWATLTPVVQERYNARFTLPHAPCRVAADIDLYNAAAAPVLARHRVAVNDLHALVERHGRDRLICDDGIHYTPEGCEILGEEVASVIRHHCFPQEISKSISQ